MCLAGRGQSFNETHGVGDTEGRFALAVYDGAVERLLLWGVVDVIVRFAIRLFDRGYDGKGLKNA